jgi:hypothetical protein
VLAVAVHHLGSSMKLTNTVFLVPLSDHLGKLQEHTLLQQNSGFFSVRMARHG